MRSTASASVSSMLRLVFLREKVSLAVTLNFPSTVSLPVFNARTIP